MKMWLGRLSTLVFLTLIMLLVSQSVCGQSTELLVNGSFAKGLDGWTVRGLVYAGQGAELYARSRVPTGISQTVERAVFSPDLTFSYKATTVFYSSAGFPFLKVSVTAYVSNQATGEETAIALYSVKYDRSPTLTTELREAAVNLKEKLLQESQLPLKRITVVFESDFEDTHVVMQSQVYIHYVSLVMATPLPPPPITTTLTITMTTIEPVTVTYAITQRVSVMSIEIWSALGLTAVVVICVVVYLYSRRRVTRP